MKEEISRMGFWRINPFSLMCATVLYKYNIYAYYGGRRWTKLALGKRPLPRPCHTTEQKVGGCWRQGDRGGRPGDQEFLFFGFMCNFFLLRARFRCWSKLNRLLLLFLLLPPLCLFIFLLLLFFSVTFFLQNASSVSEVLRFVHLKYLIWRPDR